MRIVLPHCSLKALAAISIEATTGAQQQAATMSSTAANTRAVCVCVYSCLQHAACVLGFLPHETLELFVLIKKYFGFLPHATPELAFSILLEENNQQYQLESCTGS
jgi:hypothetical protein